MSLLLTQSCGSGLPVPHRASAPGVIDGPDVPGGCWVHFSAIAMNGFRALTAGRRISFRAEPADQDGFAFRAVKVWFTGGEPADHPPAGPDSAYRSTLSPTFDDDTTRD
jgi:cold shock protein